MRRPRRRTSRRSRAHKAPAKATVIERPHLDEVDDRSGDDGGGGGSVLSMIRDIQSGSLAPSSLSLDARRACVEHLTADGFSVAEIAQVLQASDRTIARDRSALRFAHSVEASPELTRQMVGHLMREAEISVNRLRRFARGADTDVAQKIEAEKASWVVTREMLQLLQRLGYLPSAPTVISGQMLHQTMDAATSAEELHREIARIEQICLADPVMAVDSQSLRMIKQVKSTARALVRSEAPTATRDASRDKR